MTEFRGATYEDLFNLVCGKCLGEGIHRKVFECRIAPQYVVKVEDDGSNFWRYFANVKEMNFWSDHASYEKVSKWLAPCDYLSPDGRILLQKRCENVTQAFELPKEMPSFLSDLKRENFGWYEGRLVCMDYAMTIPNPNTRLKKADW